MRPNRTLRIAALMLVVALPAASQTLQEMVAARDGTLLATDVYLPGFYGSWPVVLQRTPYGKAGLRDTCLVFMGLGYACVAQDTRGRYASDGVDTVFWDDGEDGRATLDWILGQTWCDGSIGTFGGSALGITQYVMAPRADPALRCQMPAVATPDLYAHGFLQGGAVRSSLMENWLAGQGSLSILDEVRDHRLRDEFWDPVSVLGSASEVRTPALHMGGWYDIFAQGTIDAYSTLQGAGGEGARGNQVLVMGPWTHGTFGSNSAGELHYPANAALDLAEMMIGWLEWWLKGEDSGVATWPSALVYLMGASGELGAPGNRWIELEEWPPAGRTGALYLKGDGGLDWGLGEPGELEVWIDPHDPVPTLGGANLFPDLEVDGRAMGAGPHDQREVEEREDVAVFTSPILERPLTVMGRVRCRLWIRPDTQDLDLAVRLTDVYPDGRSMLVTDGIQRARMRCGDDRECLLTPGESAEVVVDLWSTALVFNQGHRVRVAVSGTNSPRFEVNPNNGEDLDGGGAPAVARPALLFGPAHPSRLELPLPLLPRDPAGRVGPGARR